MPVRELVRKEELPMELAQELAWVETPGQVQPLAWSQRREYGRVHAQRPLVLAQEFAQGEEWGSPHVLRVVP